MGLIYRLGRLPEHLRLMLASKVYRVAYPQNVKPAIIGEVCHLVDIDQLTARGVHLVCLHKVSFGVQLREVGKILIVHPVPGYEAELGGEDPDSPFLSYPKEVLWIAILGADPLAVKVLVQVFDLLVSGK